MHSNTVLLNEMLEEIVNEQVPVTLFLMNGFQIRGVVSRFDDVSIAIVADGKQQLLLKHAISTIVPIRPLKSLKHK